MTEGESTTHRSKQSVPWLVWSVWTLVIVGASVAYAWKAADSRSAFVRWRHQVLEIRDGVNIWDRYYFPNPPILPLLLYPLMSLPPLAGALIWYGLKYAMVTWSILWLTRMARGPNGSVLKSWGVGIIMLLALRPILSDLQHGNINIFILFLVMVSLLAWQRQRDVIAGLSLALAVASKVTPALFLVYFLYKRSWKTAAACAVGLVLFLLVIPSAILGPQFNWQCLMKWRQNIISPFVHGEVILSTQEVNQSMVGVMTRVLTQTRSPQAHGNNGTEHDLNLTNYRPEVVARAGKVMAIGLVIVLGLFCRTKTNDRRDPRLLAEFALVVLTMLFVSERSWKHHFVTLLLPITYLTYRVFEGQASRVARVVIALGLLLYAALMSTTSSEVGRYFAHGEGHEVALYFGLYFWSSVVLYVLTCWRMLVENRSRAREPVQGPHFSTPAARGEQDRAAAAEA